MRYPNAMMTTVPYLPKEQIEREALSLLDNYFHERGETIQVPVPADEILEAHLGLSLDFDDLQALLGIPDVLGALWTDKHKVFIDQSLDPEAHPEMEGRYNFSVGHEIGHWQLHRWHIGSDDGQIEMFGNPKLTIICRASQSKENIEWQANYFSSCFLMPRKLVFGAWSDHFGGLKPSAGTPLHTVACEFAPEFRVSIQAMQIRLETLNLPAEQDLLGGF